MKIIWIDTETTGLDPIKNGICQIAYIVEINGWLKEKGEIFFNPGDVEFEDEALKVNGRTREEITSFQSAAMAKKELERVMGKYINKFDKNDKFIPAGYNIKFDTDMMRTWWSRLGDKYFGLWFDYHALDVMAVGMVERYKGALKVENHKLATLCAHYGIELEAHDALNDIEATRELFKRMVA